MEYRLDAHTHTLASGHAYNTIMEMAAAAAEKKLELLAITDHAPKLPGSCHELYFLNLKVLPRNMCGVEMMFGTEVNIVDYDGHLDLKKNLLEKMDIVIASLHAPCIVPGSREENTRALIRAMENPLVDIIGHPDDGRYPVDYQELVKAAKENHVLLELNNNSLNPSGGRQNTQENDEIMLKLCAEQGVSIIMNSDAHWRDDIANRRYSEPLIKKINFPEELIVNRAVNEFKKYIRNTSLH